MPDAEEDEDEDAGAGADPAVVDYGAVTWGKLDLVPGGWVVDCAPGVGLVLGREVRVEDVELQRGQDEDENEGHEGEADEAGFVGVVALEEEVHGSTVGSEAVHEKTWMQLAECGDWDEIGG